MSTEREHAAEARADADMNAEREYAAEARADAGANAEREHAAEATAEAHMSAEWERAAEARGDAGMSAEQEHAAEATADAGMNTEWQHAREAGADARVNAEQKPGASEPPLDVVVIGGSQAGLAAGYYLQRAGLRFVILESASGSGHVWKSRWDSLTLFTPRGYSALPGMPFPGVDDSYPSKEDAAEYLERYRAAFDLPVRYDSRVTSLTRSDSGYSATTDRDCVVARQVIVATGPFQRPYVPPVAGDIDPALIQMHSSAYRNPDQLPAGTVLVVGGGNSGFQIAEELAATRRVELSIGKRMPSLPQRLLGHDLFWWLTRTGMIRHNVETRMGQRMSQRDFLIGSNRRGIRRAGVKIRPRLERISGRYAVFADGTDLAVDAVIWATGYRSDYSWIDVPGVLDERGAPVHRRGVTAAEGLYFLGLTWQYTRGSALIGFVQDDARFIASAVAATSGRSAAGREAGTGPEAMAA